MTAATASMFSCTVRPSASVSASSADDVGGAGLARRGPTMSAASCWNCSFLATKSVSQLSSIIAPSAAATRPLLAVRSAPRSLPWSALDAQELDGLVEVAVGLLQRLLGVHHPGAGGVAELLDVRGGEVGHASLSRSLSVGVVVSRASAGARRGRAGRRGVRRQAVSRRLGSGRLGGLGRQSPPVQPQPRAAGARSGRLRCSRCRGSRVRARAAAVAALGAGTLDRLPGGGRRRALGGLAAAAAPAPTRRAARRWRAGRRRASRRRPGGAGAGHQALGDGVGDDPGEQADRADRVVVARDLVVDLVGVAVGVEDRDDRDAQLARLADGDVLLLGVDDPHRARDAGHVADAAEGLARACPSRAAGRAAPSWSCPSRRRRRSRAARAP